MTPPPDPLALGFSHHPTAEDIATWMAIPAERKLQWLEEALELTRQMLPRERLAAWMALRGEAPGASIPIATLWDEWPAFVQALDAGPRSLAALLDELVLRHGPADGREVLLALREWAPYREAPRDTDSTLLDVLLTARR